MIASIKESIGRWFTSVKLLEPGIYHFQAPAEDPRNYRLHLRLEPDGNGILILNASTVLHLNRTAAEYAYHLVRGTSEEEAANTIASRYRISSEQAKGDYADFIERIDTLVTIQDLDPVTDLDFDRQRPYTGSISAPYRLDCALTYRLGSDESPGAAPHDRVKEELDTADWIRIIDKAWKLGIPHLLFTGGEPTLREDLVELLQRAEENGQVTGLATNGARLADSGYFDELMQTGLDHLLIVLPKLDDSVWGTLQKISKADISTTTHLTVSQENQQEIEALLRKLADIGLRSISLSSSSEDLADVLQTIREKAANLGMTLVWDIPVPYSSMNPFDLEFVGRERLSGAGRAWLYVEPDGDVLPDQSINQVLGNILSDPWEHIWHPEPVT